MFFLVSGKEGDYYDSNDFKVIDSVDSFARILLPISRQRRSSIRRSYWPK